MNERISIADKKPKVKSHNHVSQIRRKTESSQSKNSHVDRILFLQRTIGNQAVGKLIKSGALQTKLRIGQSNDIYEQEADRLAEQVIRMPDVSEAKDTRIQRKCPKCLRGLLGKDKKDEKLQAKEIRGETPEVTSNMETIINGLRGKGQPLPDSVSAFFEPSLGQDFSQVRVHSGGAAEQSAREVNAKAYTTGHNIVFGAGQFSPGTHEGRRLIAHELTHVMQQTGGLQRDAPSIQRTCGRSAIIAIAPPSCSVGDHKFVSGSLFKFNKNCDDFSPGQDAGLIRFASALPPATTFEIHSYASVDAATFNEQLSCARSSKAHSVLTASPPSGAGILASRITAIVNHGPTPGPAAERRSVVIRTSTPAPTPTPTPPTPAPPGCTSPTNPNMSGRAFNPTTDSQPTMVLKHPIDAFTVNNLATDALARASSSGLPGLHLGPADAFRHCFWNCRMAQELGATRAEQFATAHENSGPSSIPSDNQMDLHDNAFGRTLGTPGANCEAACRAAVASGQLRSIRGPDTRPLATPPVPRACIGASNQPWP